MARLTGSTEGRRPVILGEEIDQHKGQERVGPQMDTEGRRLEMQKSKRTTVKHELSGEQVLASTDRGRLHLAQRRQAMSKRAKNAQQARKNTKPAGRVSHRRGETASNGELPADYWNACEFARNGQYRKARAAYTRLLRSAAKANSRLRVLIQNDLAVLAAMEGKFDEACQGWRAAIESNGECLPARLNLGLVEAELSLSSPAVSPAELKTAPAQEARTRWL